MENNSKMRHQVFVYGTLKRGQPNYFHFERNEHGESRFIRCAVTEIAYPLVISTRWNLPFLLDAPGEGQHIFGEIYEIDDRMLEWLDGFEGHPDVYVREKVALNLLSSDVTSCRSSDIVGKAECWVYFMKKFPQEMLQLETYSSYDAHGPHNKLYTAEEDDSNSSNIEEALGQ